MAIPSDYEEHHSYDDDSYVPPFRARRPWPDIAYEPAWDPYLVDAHLEALYEDQFYTALDDEPDDEPDYEYDLYDDDPFWEG